MLSTNREPWLKNYMIYYFTIEVKYYKYQYSKITKIFEGKKKTEEGKL